MARFKLDIEKLRLNEYWTNVYYFESDDMVSATGGAENWVVAERQFHKDDVLFTKYRVSTVQEGDDVFSTVPLGVNGLLPYTGSIIPLFNVVRVDLVVEGFGRPSRKFYRVPLDEGNIEGEAQINSGMITLVFDALANLVNTVGDPTWVDESGNEIINVTPFRPIGMRQLRRGTRRRSQPIL